MKKLFSPNIGRAGRIARGLCGIAALAAAWIFKEHVLAAILLCGSGLFMLFEAFRGWCVARACGIKTPI